MLRLLLLSIFVVTPAMAAGNGVVVSIKPIHSLVASLVEGTAIQPTLLVDGTASLHDFSLKPSQAKALHDAALVVYISDDFEQFLHPLLPALPARKLSLAEVASLTLYPVRVGHGFEAHEHHHEGEEHHTDDERDLHLWMSPANARVMASAIAVVLAEQFPADAATIAANETKLDARLAALDTALRTRMKLLSGKPFAVFHDATQYFDRAYGLDNIGAITVHPGRGLSAKTIRELRGKILGMHAACVFREPQFDGRVVDNIMQGTGANTAVLDAEGAMLAPGAELYFRLMEGIAASMESCLN